jgi:hypothetical protein
MPIGFRRQASHELVALVSSGVAIGSRGAGVSLVDDDQLRTGAQELVSPTVSLDEVG